MIITELRITNLRNLAQVTLCPHARLNFVTGDNGAGKTSILESMVVLSRGRSFRTSQATELSGPEDQGFRVFASLLLDDESTCKLGLERFGKNWRAKKNSVELKQISQLTRSLPLMLMEPNSHLLVSGTPDYRRKYLDWGVFHVEHDFLDTWSRFSRVLKQRNAALRNRQQDVLESLDSLLAPLGEQLTAYRETIIGRIRLQLDTLMEAMGHGLSGIKLAYDKGWQGESYAASLAMSRERDMERGVTQQGPHRADLTLRAGKNSARAVLSRGEQKTLSAALLLAQATLISKVGERPVILLDDLASEFDTKHVRSVLERSLVLGGQVWVSGTSVPDLPGDHKVFHVEHGVVKEMV